MKEATTKIVTARTELTLTLWTKGDTEVSQVSVYVFTPKAPITIDDAKSMVSKKHYYIKHHTNMELEVLEEKLNNAQILDVELGAHVWCEKEITVSEWTLYGNKSSKYKYDLSRNIHSYIVPVLVYDKVAKQVEQGAQYRVNSFRPLITDSIVKSVKSYITTYQVLLEIDTDHVAHLEQTYYLPEAQVYKEWL